MKKWVIFDMDNTLINTEPLYLDAIEKFLTIMVGWGFSRDKVAKRQAAIDAGLLAKMGYSTDRFAESFELTYMEFQSQRVYGDGDVIPSAASMANNVELVRSIRSEERRVGKECRL